MGVVKTLSVLRVVIFALIAAGTAGPIWSDSVQIERERAKDEIRRFLSSLEPAAEVYHFDHDDDGVLDLSIRPVIGPAAPDSERYVTLAQAMRSGQVVLRENRGHYAPAARRLSSGTRGARTSIQGSSSTRRTTYAQRGSSARGGGQSRGFGRSRTMRGGGSGRSSSRSDGRSSGSVRGATSRTSRDVAEVTLDVVCFEQGRSIRASLAAGGSDRFAYAGLASPSVRKALILSTRQSRVDRLVVRELRALRVRSSTASLVDIFEDPYLKEVIDYYVRAGQEVLYDHDDLVGMIVTDRRNIICMDVYGSSQLFQDMLPHLLQSAALEVCRRPPRSRNRGGLDVEHFLRESKQARGWRSEDPQSYVLKTPKNLIAATFDRGQVIHIEAYPR